MAALMQGHSEDQRRVGSSPRPKGRGKRLSHLDENAGAAYEKERALLMLMPIGRECKGYLMQECNDIRSLSLRRQR